MAVYTYVCSACTHTHTIVRSIHDSEEIPVCQAHGPMRRKYDTPAIQVH